MLSSFHILLTRVGKNNSVLMQCNGQLGTFAEAFPDALEALEDATGKGSGGKGSGKGNTENGKGSGMGKRRRRRHRRRNQEAECDMDVQVVRPPDVTGEGLDPFEENEQILPEDITNNPNVSIPTAPDPSYL